MAKALTRRPSPRRKGPDPHERELKRLRLSVCDDIGFRLYLATYDQPKRRDELIARVIEEAAAEKVRVTRMDIGEAGPETGLVGLLRAHLRETELPPGWRQAVMVTGIEQRLDYGRGRDGFAFLHQANLLRDALLEAAPVPVVLWLSRMASAALPAEAPDLWHWRAANFDFTGDEAPRVELLRELTTLQPEGDLGTSRVQREARVRLLEDLLAELEREGPPKTKRQAAERANLLLELALDERRGGRAAESIPHIERALELYRAIGHRQAEGASLGNLGIVYLHLGEFQRAIELHEQALAIAREIGDRQGEENALGNLGNTWTVQSEPQRAIKFYERALAIARQIGDRQGEENALGNIGNTCLRLSEPQRAIKYYKQALTIAREIGDRPGEGAALGNLGVANVKLAEARRAIDYLEQALKVFLEIGERQGTAAALGALGLAWADLGEPRRAIQFYDRWLKIASEIGDRRGEASALLNSALALDDVGERAEAVRRIREALAIFQAIGAEHLVQKARAKLAEWGADGVTGSDAEGSGEP